MRRILSLLVACGYATAVQLPEDYSCPIFIYTPLAASEEGTTCESCEFNLGLSYLTAILIAIEQFNNRDILAVPELEKYLDCPIQIPFPGVSNETFPLEKGESSILSSRSKVFNTGTFTTEVATEFKDQLPEVPCIAVGPFHDKPALAMAGISHTFSFPLVIGKAQDVYAIDADVTPTTRQVYPDSFQNAHALVRTLQYLGRTDYIATIYPVSPFGTQIREVLSVSLDLAGIEHRNFGVFGELLDPGVSEDMPEVTAELDSFMQRVKASGYRTIVLALENPTLEVPALAEAAIRAGLTNGDFLWLHFGEFEFNHVFDGNDVVTQFLAGSLASLPLELSVFFDTDEPTDIVSGWLDIDEEFVERIKMSYPRNAPGGEDVASVSVDFYAENTPQYLSGFAYDAVLTAAMGTCEAWFSQQSRNIPIEEHMVGLDNVAFLGPSGYVFYDGSSRHESGLIFGILNVLPPGSTYPNSTEPVEFEITGIVFAGTEYEELLPNVFADGRNVPPNLLRDLPEQNYLGEPVRIVGLVLVGFTVATGAVAAAWTYFKREHKVLRAAQPRFLYLLCFGSMVLACAIIPLSFDESYDRSTIFLSQACVSIPWLFAGGYIIIYGALFMKLWRVNRVLQFARRQIDMKQVAWPFALVMAAGVTVLTTWTVVDPLEWERKELNSESGESIGRCNSDNMVKYLIPLVMIMLIPAGLTLLMSWKTRDVDDSYSESFWIMFMVIVQFEVIIISLPMVGILREVSTEGRYLGFSFLIWILPISTLGLIFGPKVRAVYKGESTVRSRGAMGGNVHISGVNVGGSTGQAVSAISATGFSVTEGSRPKSDHEFSEGTAGREALVETESNVETAS